jgi:hypothetical protein
MRTTTTTNLSIIIIFLYTIFLVTVIPTIYVYIEHANVEKEAYEGAKTETKKIKTLSEALVFYGIGIGYVIASFFMLLLKPKNPIPYLVILVGTVAIFLLWLFRIYGIPILGTDIVITDMSMDWRDVVTKSCQVIMLVPVSMLLILRTRP